MIINKRTFISICDIKVSATVVTAQDGARILNSIRPVMDSSLDSYYFVNVLNEDITINERMGVYFPVKGKENHPLTGLSYYGAKAIADAVNCRIPTLVEWMNISSAHTKAFPWGERYSDYAYFCNSSELIGTTSDVFKFPPSDLGLYDLIGNVGEWCEDSTSIGESETGYIMGGGWNKEVSEFWKNQLRLKWKRFGSVATGVRLVY